MNKKIFCIFIIFLMLTTISKADEQSKTASLAINGGSLFVYVGQGKYKFKSIDLQAEMDKYQGETTDYGNIKIRTNLRVYPDLWIINSRGLPDGVSSWRLYFRCSKFKTNGYSISAKKVFYNTRGGQITRIVCQNTAKTTKIKRNLFSLT